MNNPADNNAVPAAYTPRFRPKFTLYHPNGKGSGGALELELHPAHDRVDGSIMMRVANQMTIGNRQGPNPVFPRFDWENSATVKLDFNDLCKMLQVFRGECESINDDRGLFHASPRATTKIFLKHLLEPIVGYSLELYRVPRNGGDELRMHLVLNSAEALGICEAISDSLSLICFGIPMVIPHDTSAYQADVKDLRDANAVR